MPAKSFPEELPGSKLHSSALGACVTEPATVSVTVAVTVVVTAVGLSVVATGPAEVTSGREASALPGGNEPSGGVPACEKNVRYFEGRAW